MSAIDRLASAGRTPRRSFCQANADLIHRFTIILNTIIISKNIDVGKFHTHGKDTAKLYVELYGCYYMPITVQKVLIHGSKMVSEALPVALFTIFIFESIFLNYV